jgi:hypothetical protein
MSWIGALINSLFSRQRKNAEQDESHADKLDYPTNANLETSISTIARAQVATAKDADTTQKYQSAYNKRTFFLSLWAAVGVSVYTVLTLVIVIFSVVQYGESHRFNKRQSHFFNDQIEIMRGQLDEMRLQMIAAQRAWIKIVDISVAPPGLKIDNDDGALLQVALKVRNTGNIPAIHGTWHVWLVPGAAGTGHEIPSNPRDRTCDETRNQPFGSGGETVFPTDEYPPQGTLFAGAGASKVEIVNTFNRGQPIPETFDLHVVGCFDYTFSTDSINHHQTSFRRALFRRVSNASIITIPRFDYTLNMGIISEHDLEIVGNIVSAD